MICILYSKYSQIVYIAYLSANVSKILLAIQLFLLAFFYIRFGAFFCMPFRA